MFTNVKDKITRQVNTTRVPVIFDYGQHTASRSILFFPGNNIVVVILLKMLYRRKLTINK